MENETEKKKSESVGKAGAAGEYDDEFIGQLIDATEDFVDSRIGRWAKSGKKKGDVFVSGKGYDELAKALRDTLHAWGATTNPHGSDGDYEIVDVGFGMDDVARSGDSYVMEGTVIGVRPSTGASKSHYDDGDLTYDDFRFSYNPATEEIKFLDLDKSFESDEDEIRSILLDNLRTNFREDEPKSGHAKALPPAGSKPGQRLAKKLYRKMMRTYGRKLRKDAREARPWDYEYGTEAFADFLRFMKEYYALRHNVQCGEIPDAPTRLDSLTRALREYDAFCLADATLEAKAAHWKAFWKIVSDEGRGWWD